MLTLECTSGSEGLTVVAGDNLTIVYVGSPGDYNTVVSKHFWWFSASQGISSRRIKLLKASQLLVGYRNAIVRAEVEPLMKRILPSLAIATLCATGLLVAQDPDGQSEPGRAVARISVLNGDVSVRRGDSGDVVAAAINGPIMADDRILTGASSRAEVELDFANAIRIGPSSEVRFSGMDVNSFQIQVAVGTATFRVLRPSQAQSEVDTPSVALHPLRQGIYRVSVREDGTSEITVRSGQADIYSANGSQRLESGQTMNARGSAADTEFQIVQAIPPDSWDRWNEDRDHYLERSQSSKYVSPDVYGAEDLDQYGQWTNDPTYGNVWAPNVAPGWAPYRDGRWVWQDYYGWTWVSYDPWGWAPYHYGRWFWGSGRWCWYPGSIYGHYGWSPALVGFFGYGGGFGGGVGFGFGGVGWVPLAPFEVFHPWWGRGFYGGFRNGGFNNTTIVNNVNVFNSFRNARINGAVTGVNTANFGRQGRFTSLDRGQIQQAGLVHGALPVAPDRASLRMSDRAVSGNFAQSRVQSFATRNQAPRVEHFSFDQQQRAMQQMSRSDFTQSGRTGAGNSSGFARTMPNTGAGVNQSNRGGDPASSGNRGWGRFGQPGNANAAPQSQAPAARSFDNSGASRGWQRFENSAPSGGSSAVHISPPIVQQRSRGDYAPPNYNAPRPNAPSFDSPARNYQQQAPRSYEAPRSYGGGGSPAPRSFGGAPSGGGGGVGGARSSGGNGGGGARSSGGSGGGHSGGGGGGHSGGGGHR